MQTDLSYLKHRLRIRVAWILGTLAVVLITAVIYWPGLHGPFLLDDVGNLDPVSRWLHGDLDWQAVIFDNRSGPGGRPVSMVTFLADAWRTGSMDSFTFKLTNLVIHLLAGSLAFVLACQIVGHTIPDRGNTLTSAVVIALIWLWMPIQVSTTLYVVQRMAQLSALLTFATLSVYLLARRDIIAHRRRGYFLLWAGVPALAAVATLAKENGALTLPLAALLEIALYRAKDRPRSVYAFHAVMVGFPLLSVMAFLVSRPDIITQGYALRDFSLHERLLTEPRVLWSYLQTSFFPVGQNMGLYHDNFRPSTSLLNPLTTLVAITGWIVVAAWAWLWRKRAPLFLVGVMGYLIGMSLESGPISLELYFEHRNYGPLFFALLGIAGLLLPLVERTAMKASAGRAASVCLGLVLAVYAFGTWNQASGWTDIRTFNAVQYGYNPTSPRLLSGLTAQAMLRKDLPSALAFIDASERSGPPSERSTATLWRFLAYCEASDHPHIPPSLYDELDERARGRITTYGMIAWDLLADRLAKGCGDVNRPRITRAGTASLEKTAQGPLEQPVWRTRYNIGRITADDGDLRAAQALVERAWHDSERNSGVGVLLFQLDASLGDLDGCREVLANLERSDTGRDRRMSIAVQTFRTALDKNEIGKPSP